MCMAFTCDKTRKLRRYPNKSYSLAKFRKQPKTLKMKLSTTNEKKSKQTRSKRRNIKGCKHRTFRLYYYIMMVVYIASHVS
jgi:hypothetical protein